MQTFNLFSTTSMVIFVELVYILVSSPPFNSLKLEIAKIYHPQGEMCDILEYWQIHRNMLIFSYLVACSLKVFNSVRYFKLQIEIEANLTGKSEEDV